MVRIVKEAEEYKYKYKKITLTVSDPDNKIEDLLNYLKSNSDPGHSFNIIVDPGSELEKTFEIDGDGVDHIHKIDVERVEKL